MNEGLKVFVWEAIDKNGPVKLDFIDGIMNSN